jgi:hypothetical protein
MTRWLWSIIKGALGRITTALGGLLTLADMDISPIKPLLEEVLSHQEVVWLTLVLFIASYLRHHWANKRDSATP